MIRVLLVFLHYFVRFVMVYFNPGLFLSRKKTRVRKLSRKSPRSVTCRFCGYNSVLSVKVQAGAFSQEKVLLLQL